MHSVVLSRLLSYTTSAFFPAAVDFQPAKVIVVFSFLIMYLCLIEKQRIAKETSRYMIWMMDGIGSGSFRCFLSVARDYGWILWD